MKADSYSKKRDFSRTPEPQGGKRKPGEHPLFVIQQHDASSMHYDFRLEVDGVLKSWAVPKGPSTDPREKRLAMSTEDHPLDYADFEGVIPKGEYGAGPVIVWDTGRYENIAETNSRLKDAGQALADGHFLVSLHGHKLSGGYALQRIGRGSNRRWLLVKMKDEHADARRNPVSTQPKSVLSGETIKTIVRQAAHE